MKEIKNEDDDEDEDEDDSDESDESDDENDPDHPKKDKNTVVLGPDGQPLSRKVCCCFILYSFPSI